MQNKKLQFKDIIDIAGKELRGSGISDYELFYVESDDLTIELKEKKVDSLEKAIDKSVSLRVLDEGRLGFSYCTKLTNDGIIQMAQSARQTSLKTKADASNAFARKGYDTPPKLNDYDESILDITFDEKVAALQALEDAAYGYDERVKSARKLSFRQSLKSVRIFNTHGIDCAHTKTIFSFSAIVAASDGSSSEISWESDYSNIYSKLDPPKIGGDAAKKACDQLGGRVIKSANLPVVLDRLIASELLGVLATSFYADYIMKQKSAFIGKSGERVLSDNVSIVDDPLYDGGIASFPFDAEGSASQRTEVIKDGVLTSYLTDTYTSSKMGLANTSNSVKRSLFAPPSVGITNFYLVPGTKSRAGLLKDMGRGLWVTEAMGLHTANPISGDFSIGISGFMVEGGEVAFPVKGLVFSGNIFKILNDVKEIANDLKFYEKSAAPSILIAGADIAGE